MNPVLESVSLLIAASREEEAESLVESLRGGGLSVQTIGSRTPERLKELVSEEGVELILFCAYDPEVDLETWMAQYANLGKDVPFIIIADQATDSSVVVDALHSGARGLTTKGDTEHLRALIARELPDLELRPPRNLSLRWLEQREKSSRDRDGAVLDEERRIAGCIQRALDGDGFELFYQPIVSLRGDRRESYQVLLRLRDEDGTLREAKDFLDIATKSGAMAAVDRWVFRNAISELAAQRSKGQEVNFFVNIAEATLQEDKLLVWICDCLRDCKARGNWLTLEILEEHARGNAAVFARLSNGLRKVGCRIALDRFGEGQKPETLLRSLRPDYVKFPPDPGSGLADDRAKRRRLQELTKLSRDAGVKSIVTGLEDARSLTVLWTAGIDYVQGNFLQRPSPTMDQE
jgi:EAL domain-containing protein (putative c-di-GMP-specific phosphodiesterase class I)